MKRTVKISIALLVLSVGAWRLVPRSTSERAPTSDTAERSKPARNENQGSRLQAASEREALRDRRGAQAENLEEAPHLWAEEMDRRYGNPELTKLAQKWDNLRVEAREAAREYVVLLESRAQGTRRETMIAHVEEQEYANLLDAKFEELVRLRQASTLAANKLRVFYLQYMADNFDVRLD